jgi:uncharacterized protein (DUF983 family)
MLVAQMRKPVPRTMILRGLRRRCARCGAKVPFVDYFHIDERCTRCGYRFVREEGSFTGVYLVNYSVTAVVLVILIMGAVLFIAVGDVQVPIVPVLVAGFAIAIAVPVLFYPFAVTTWAAIDLLARPLEPDEEAEAATYAARDERPT